MSVEEQLKSLENRYESLNEYLQNIEKMIASTNELMLMIQQDYVEVVYKSIEKNSPN